MNNSSPDPEPSAEHLQFRNQVQEEIGEELKELTRLAVSIADKTGVCVSRFLGGHGENVGFFSCLLTGPLNDEQLKRMEAFMLGIVDEIRRDKGAKNFEMKIERNDPTRN